MGNELIPGNITTALVKHDWDAAEAGEQTYLSRLQLFGSKSDACATGEIKIGHYGLVKDSGIVDLGPELDAVIVSWHFKTLQIDDGTVIIEHDPTTELYQKIKELSFVSDSGCMYGREFLLWVPDQDQFVTYFMASKTARREAKKLKPLIGKAATFKCKLIEYKKWKWHGPIIIPCSAPLEVPPLDVIQKVVDIFQNPPKSDVELAPEEEEGRAR